MRIVSEELIARGRILAVRFGTVLLMAFLVVLLGELIGRRLVLFASSLSLTGLWLWQERERQQAEAGAALCVLLLLSTGLQGGIDTFEQKISPAILDYVTGPSRHDVALAVDQLASQGRAAIVLGSAVGVLLWWSLARHAKVLWISLAESSLALSVLAVEVLSIN